MHIKMHEILLKKGYPLMFLAGIALGIWLGSNHQAIFLDLHENAHIKTANYYGFHAERTHTHETTITYPGGWRDDPDILKDAAKIAAAGNRAVWLVGVIGFVITWVVLGRVMRNARRFEWHMIIGVFWGIMVGTFFSVLSSSWGDYVHIAQYTGRGWTETRIMWNLANYITAGILLIAYIRWYVRSYRDFYRSDIEEYHAEEPKPFQNQLGRHKDRSS